VNAEPRNIQITENDQVVSRFHPRAAAVRVLALVLEAASVSYASNPSSFSVPR
jgi:hypothetical protein